MWPSAAARWCAAGDGPRRFCRKHIRSRALIRWPAGEAVHDTPGSLAHPAGGSPSRGRPATPEDPECSASPGRTTTSDAKKSRPRTGRDGRTINTADILKKRGRKAPKARSPSEIYTATEKSGNPQSLIPLPHARLHRHHRRLDGRHRLRLRPGLCDDCRLDRVGDCACVSPRRCRRARARSAVRRTML